MVLSNSYLYQSRHSIYYFRAIVPSNPREGKHHYEYRRSLRTKDIRVARSRGRLLRIYVELYQEGVRYGYMEWREFKELLDQSLKAILKAQCDHISTNGPYPTSAESLWRDNHIKNYKEAVDRVSLQRMGLNSTDPIPSYAYRVTDDYFNDHNKQILHTDQDYFKYCEAILHMQIEFYQQMMQLNEKARSFNGPVGNLGSHVEISEKTDFPLISEVAKKFCIEKVKEGSWRDKTLRENEASFRLLINVINDGPISSVNYPVAQHFKAVLMQLPSNMNKKPQYREKTIDQIRAISIPKEHLLSVSKINAYLSQVSSLFNWAMKQGFVGLNPFEGLKLKDNVAGKDKKLPFTNEDLQLIFSAKEYQTGKQKHAYCYWLPLLGLYTGARIEELCQLYLNDIYQVQGLWVFDLNDKDGKKLKNKPSCRIFPVHTKLVQLGFIDYVMKLQKQGVDRLFPELKRRKDGYSVDASRWFGRFWQRCKTDHTRKSFHSFRHTALNHWKQNEIPKEKFIAVSGHKDESIATGWYGNSYDPQVLVSVIEALDFPMDVPAYNKLMN